MFMHLDVPLKLTEISIDHERCGSREGDVCGDPGKIPSYGNPPLNASLWVNESRIVNNNDRKRSLEDSKV